MQEGHKLVYFLILSSYWGLSYASLIAAEHESTSFARVIGQPRERIPHHIESSKTLTQSNAELRVPGNAGKLRVETPPDRARVTLGELLAKEKDQRNVNLEAFREGTDTSADIRKAETLKSAFLEIYKSLSLSVKRALSPPENHHRRVSFERAKVKIFRKKPKIKPAFMLNANLEKELGKAPQKLNKPSYSKSKNSPTHRGLFTPAKFYYVKPPSTKIRKKVIQPKALQEALENDSSVRKEKSFEFGKTAESPKGGPGNFGQTRKGQGNELVNKNAESHKIPELAEFKNLPKDSEDFSFSKSVGLENSLTRSDSFSFPLSYEDGSFRGMAESFDFPELAGALDQNTEFPSWFGHVSH
ncbi:hypothetical protein PPACK8108_LOCUS23265 [Phakopsora pachyrhizi]|uniref:Uncharacterized protein n=1 Tax=Phakopsora pachyrhizi TaxID=170000 RepID=A0AAV0BMP1_PHAPC|nr:hypothetical protein PPACK8108_LOCUS23265 [Phakopsora pachyrhizi]